MCDLFSNGMGSGTKEFKEEAPGLYQGSSLTAGLGLGGETELSFFHVGIPPAQTLMGFVWCVLKISLLSSSTSLYPDIDVCLFLYISWGG